MPSEKSRLLLLVKDPHWTFVSWRLSRQDMEDAIARHGGAGGQLTVRIYDVTGLRFDGQNAHSSFDVTVSEEADHWYLNFWSSDRNYCADIGYSYLDGGFVALCRSNVIYLPRDHPSDSTEETWSTIHLGNGRRLS